MACTKIYLREEQEENYEELHNYNIAINVDKKRNLIIGNDYIYRRDFREGDVVTANNVDFGYVYKIDNNNKEVKVEWGFGFCDWENNIDLLIVPYEYGIESLYNTANRHRVDPVVKGWLKVINGYSYNNVSCLFNDSEYKKVDFIKYKDGSLYDEKIDRTIKLYREVGKYTVYKAPMFDGTSLRYLDQVFYIFDSETKEVYFGGIKDEIRVTLAILYSKI